MIPRKHHFWSFLAITITVFQIQMILILIPLQYEDDGMEICAKHKNFIQSGNDSLKTPFLFVFGYNNCSVSNPNVTRYIKTRLTSQNFVLRKTTNKWKNDYTYEDDIFTSTYVKMHGEHAGAFALAHKLTVCKLQRKKRRSLEIFHWNILRKGGVAYLESRDCTATVFQNGGAIWTTFSLFSCLLERPGGRVSAIVITFVTKITMESRIN